MNKVDHKILEETKEQAKYWKERLACLESKISWGKWLLKGYKRKIKRLKAKNENR